MVCPGLDRLVRLRMRAMAVRGPMRNRFAAVQVRDLLLVLLPLLALVGGAIWLATRFVDPPPPRTFVMSTASVNSPYHRYAGRYKEAFKRHGVELQIRTSEGSLIQ